LPEAFKKWRVKILRSSCITIFLVLHQEHLKKQPGPMSPVFKPVKYVSDEQLYFEKLAVQCPPFLKAILPVWKAFSNLKIF
jgi:hypothetical protein